jgi:hypothetical protein
MAHKTRRTSDLARQAKAIVALAFRNGPLEAVHAGKICPRCHGRPEYSHVTDAEIKAIMQNAVDHLYRLLWLKENDPERYQVEIEFGSRYTTTWGDPVEVKPVPMTERTKSHQTHLSHGQMRAAIPKIDRCAADLEALLATLITDIGDERLGALERKLDTFLTDTFGADSAEYERYWVDFTCLRPMSWHDGMTSEEIAAAVSERMRNAKAHLEAMKSAFGEKLADAGKPSEQRRSLR